MSGKKASKVMTPQNEAEDEATRRIKARRARQSRRSTQGVTLDNVEEAQKLSAGSVSEKKSELLGHSQNTNRHVATQDTRRLNQCF